MQSKLKELVNKLTAYFDYERQDKSQNIVSDNKRIKQMFNQPVDSPIKIKENENGSVNVITMLGKFNIKYSQAEYQFIVTNANKKQFVFSEKSFGEIANILSPKY